MIQGIEEHQQDSKSLQYQGKRPSPCARFCEANAFHLEISRLTGLLTEQQDVTSGYIEQLAAKDAEIERHIDTINETIALYSSKLAACQAREKVLREALEYLDTKIVTMDLGGVVKRALETPSDDSALRKYVANEMRNMCWSGSFGEESQVVIQDYADRYENGEV